MCDCGLNSSVSVVSSSGCDDQYFSSSVLLRKLLQYVSGLGSKHRLAVFSKR
jgi:hypothetical protein